MEETLVSVIIPNYNHAQYLPQRIESVLNQTFQNFEIVILDDCSADGSREIIEQYRQHPKVSKIIYNDANSGSPFRQWNKGIAVAKTKLVWIAESDDLAHPAFLESAVRHFSDREVALVYSKVINFTDEKLIKPQSVTGNFLKFDGDAFIAQKMLGINSILTGSMVVFRKKTLPDLIIANKKWYELAYSGDHLLWILVLQNAKLVENQDILAYRRLHNNNVTNAALRKGIDMLENLDIYKKIIQSTQYKIKQKNIIYNQFFGHYWQNRKHYSVKAKFQIFGKMAITDILLFLFLFLKICKTKLAPARALLHNVRV